MGYFKKISPLREKALYQVALNLAEDNSFKEVAMCLEKPTYGFFINDRWEESSYLINGVKSLSEYSKAKNWKVEEVLDKFSWIKNSLSNQNEEELWNNAAKKQCERLIVRFPSSLKYELHVWLNRFALEFLSYSRRQELLFGVSRYFLMAILTRNDWTEAGRLNEKKIANRLINDERLTILQRYQIACVYCLEMNIAELWNRLTQVEKQSVSKSNENKSLVLLWSIYMNGPQNKEITQKRCHLWSSVAKAALHNGNQTTLMLCWENLLQHERQQLIVDMAHKALISWDLAVRNPTWKINLISNECYNTSERHECIKKFNLPNYYSELVCFFLQKMSEEQMFAFFESVFENDYRYFHLNPNQESILEFLLDWPVQDYFLQTMNLLWGKMLPEYNYELCLSSLVYRYISERKTHNSLWNCKIASNKGSCDYRILLWNLWELTPENYKNYLFYNNKRESDDEDNTTLIQNLLFQLLKKCPFQEEDVALFKRIWHDLPKEIKKMVIELGKGDICWMFIEMEKWSLLNWLIKESLPDAEIPSYKKQLIQSKCLTLLFQTEIGYKFVEALIDWCFELDIEKTQFKYEMLNQGLYKCSRYLCTWNFSKVEDMINFWSSSNEMKKEFKMKVCRVACNDLLKDCEWAVMDDILAWCYDYKEEEMRNFKDLLCFSEGISVHCELVFFQREWKNVECFYRWFCLSPEEIMKIKKETLFMPKTINHVCEALFRESPGEVESSLRWCVINEEMITNFKKEVEKSFLDKVLWQKNDEKAKECLSYLVSKLQNGFRKEAIENTTDSGTVSVKDNSEKRGLVKHLGKNKKSKIDHC